MWEKYFRVISVFWLAFMLAFQFHFVSPVSANSGYLSSPGDYVDVSYSVSGASLGTPSDSKTERSGAFYGRREYDSGELGSGTLTVSGTGSTEVGDPESDVSSLQVTVRAGGESEEHEISFPGSASKNFEVSVPIPEGATSGSFSIRVVGRPSAAMTRTDGVTVSGSFSREEPVPPAGIWGGLTRIPPPDNAAQAAAGILIPGLIAIGLDLLGRRGSEAVASALGETVGKSPEEAVDQTTTYDFGDGRDYQEGGSYIFDNGTEYRVKEGEFVPTRELDDGERYVNPDGDKKIWVGGRSWHESDWTRQQATNETYADAHQQDWENHLEQRRQEEAEALRRREIKRKEAEMEAERLETIAEQVKSGRHSLSESDIAGEFVERLEETGKNLRETGEINEFDQRIIDRNFERVRPDMEQMQEETIEELDKANRSARNWDRATRGAETVENIANESIDGLAKITGPPGRKLQGVYHGGRGLLGGLSEGYAYGEYGRSLLEHTSAAGADLVEARLEGRSEDAFNVGREVVEGSYKHYKKGESIMEGALEGAAESASNLTKDKLPDGYKEAYKVSKNAFIEGLNSYRDGSSFLDGAMDGAIESSQNVVIEKGVDYAGDMVAPRTNVGEEAGIEFVFNTANKETRKLIKESFKS